MKQNISLSIVSIAFETAEMRCTCLNQALHPCPKLINVLIWITIKWIPQIPVNTCVRSNVPKCTQKSLRERSQLEWIPFQCPTFLQTKATKGANPPHTWDPKSCQYDDEAPPKLHISQGGRIGVYFDWCITNKIDLHNFQCLWGSQTLRTETAQYGLYIIFNLGLS